MDTYTSTNRANWDERVPIHAHSQFYNLSGFKAGSSSLNAIELAELGGEVAGKRLLHLQCHFGMDTLSWARLGAEVTGVDFSPAAIDLARSLSNELGLAAQWVCSDVLKLRDVLTQHYDIVYTSYGVLPWLADLQQWARVIAASLVPGGTFYIVEDHPLTTVFDTAADDTKLVATYTYFPDPKPNWWAAGPTYTDGDEVPSTANYEWTHSMGEVISVLAGAGLRIEYLHEFPRAGWRRFPMMKRREDGWWHLPGEAQIPLTFSLRATKPET